MTLVLRPLETGDYAAAAEMMLSLHNFHADARPDLMLRRETPPSPEEFAQMLRENDSLAAETDGRLAGFLLWQPRAYPEDLEEGRRAYDAFALIDLYTLPQFRRRGVATALFSEVRARAEAAGAAFLELNVYHFNANAYALYTQKFGMRPRRTSLELPLLKPLPPLPEAPADVSVRPMDADDYVPAAAMMQSLHNFHADARPDLLLRKSQPDSKESFAALLQRRLCFMAEAGGRPAGMAILALRRFEKKPGSYFAPHAFGKGMALYVEPAFRRRGVATALLRAMLRACEERRLDSFQLKVYRFNTAAYALYTQGFSMQPMRSILELPLSGKGAAR